MPKPSRSWRLMVETRDPANTMLTEADLAIAVGYLIYIVDRCGERRMKSGYERTKRFLRAVDAGV